MNGKTFQHCLFRTELLVANLFLALFVSPSEAETLQVPWECSTYQGDAQTRCVNALLEAQQKKIAELEGKLQAQQSTVGQLKDQLNRQTTATSELQRQLTERSTANVVPYPYYPYPYSYSYAPGLGLGFGLHFGSSGMYLSPYSRPYYNPFWGHRHFDYWGYRW